MINSVVLSGRWTKDNQLRYSTSQVASLFNVLANDRGYGDKKKTNFIGVKMIGKLAESISNITEKGTLLEIVGELETYADREGKTQMVVFAREVIKLPGQKKAEDSEQLYKPTEEDDDLPF